MQKRHQNLSIYTWPPSRLCGFAAVLDLHLSECPEGHSATNAPAGTSSASPPAAVSPLPLAWNPRCPALSVLTSVLTPAKLMLKCASAERTSFISIPAFRFQQEFFFNRITFQVVFIFNYENERWKPKPFQNPISKWRKLGVTLSNSFRVRCSWTQGKSWLYQRSSFPSGDNGALAKLTRTSYLHHHTRSQLNPGCAPYISGAAPPPHPRRSKRNLLLPTTRRQNTHRPKSLIPHFVALSLFVCLTMRRNHFNNSEKINMLLYMLWTQKDLYV